MNDMWATMRDFYRKMGLSEEEIANRILCKTIKVIECSGNLDDCDKTDD